MTNILISNRPNYKFNSFDTLHTFSKITIFSTNPRRICQLEWKRLGSELWLHRQRLVQCSGGFIPMWFSVLGNIWLHALHLELLQWWNLLDEERSCNKSRRILCLHTKLCVWSSPFCQSCQLEWKQLGSKLRLQWPRLVQCSGGSTSMWSSLLGNIRLHTLHLELLQWRNLLDEERSCNQSWRILCFHSKLCVWSQLNLLWPFEK
jgi:hypothetical protein